MNSESRSKGGNEPVSGFGTTFVLGGEHHFGSSEILMLIANLRHTLRHLQRQPAYTAINVLGLALGLACALLIFLYVADEHSFDTMHANADRIYRIEMDLPQGEGVTRWGAAVYPVAEMLQDQVPGIESTVRVQGGSEPLIGRTGTDIQFYESTVIETEPSFFEVFDFQVLQGDVARLAEPKTAFLSESAAARYFPDTSPIGQSLSRFQKWEAGETTYEIVGVIADMPHNVHFRGDIILSMQTDAPAAERAWFTLAYTYVLIHGDVPFETIPAHLDALQPELAEQFVEGARLAPVPLRRIHLYGEAENDIAPQGDIRYVYLFSAIALLILLIACINYTNLATARAAQRAKEVGVRKSVGAARGQLIGQFLGESVLMALGAVVLAVGFVQLALPAFNGLMERGLALPMGHPMLWMSVLGIGSIVGLLAGVYPAFVLSLFRPAQVLKGSVRVRSLPALRKGLIVFQFAISVVLIVCTLVIQDQLHFVQHSRLGFDKDQVVVVRTRAALPEASAVSFQQALAQHPSITTVARASGVPSEPTAIRWFSGDDIEAFEGEQTIVFQSISASPELAEALQLELVAGRFFDPSRPADLEDGLVLNETAVRKLGWDQPIGKTIQNGEQTLTVVGVVRDFHMEDMRTAIEPLLVHVDPAARRYYTVRFNTADVPGMLAHLEATWQQFLPDKPFDYSFLDDDFAAMYRTEQRLGQLFIVFAMLAVCIACLGLFGLTAYIVQQRTKEIGIRKVLGASVADLLGLLSKDFVVLVLIAFVLAGPLAYLAMQRWLADFAYRTELGASVFLVALGIALGIALLTVSIHLLKAARANPVDSLRTS
ncbi:MAG: ABC transporter permease [Rhodothermales bacterium]